MCFWYALHNMYGWSMSDRFGKLKPHIIEILIEISDAFEKAIGDLCKSLIYEEEKNSAKLFKAFKHNMYQ